MSGYHAKTHFLYHFCGKCCDDKGKQVVFNDHCPDCHGTGKPCSLCHGTGKVEKEIKCRACGQTRKIIEKPCPNLKK